MRLRSPEMILAMSLATRQLPQAKSQPKANLLAQASPCWTVRHHRDDAVSLMPSVWRTNGCRSHFFVRNSRIDWCRFR